MKKKKENLIPMLITGLPLTALALYILHLISGFNDTDGNIYISYNSTYPVILFGEYALITALLIPFILKGKKEQELNLYTLPLMLFSAHGMMRIDTTAPISSVDADHSPAVMFIILFVTLFVMAFSKHTLTGAAGTVIGTAVFPAFGICFSPFIAAAAFLFNNEKKKEQLISEILNSVISLAALIYAAVKLEPGDLSFNIKYVPVFILIAAAAAFMIFRKEYKLLPLSLLPLFPLATGILFSSFITPIFTLAASVAPFVILLGTAATAGNNQKIKGYAKELSHNPVIYIIVAVFILHTAGAYFANPGYFRDIYT